MLLPLTIHHPAIYKSRKQKDFLKDMETPSLSVCQLELSVPIIHTVFEPCDVDHGETCRIGNVI
jgi:hypothetical protein